MKKIIPFLLVIISFAHCFKADAYDYYGRKKYHLAVQVTNPLSLGSKGGGFLEYRNHQVSEVVGYTKYWDAYAGTQYSYQIMKFFRSRRKPHEYFLYFKGVMGDALYSSKKLAMFGDASDILIGPVTYFGGGLGVGRRYNYNTFFFSWNLGAKYCTIVDDLSADDKRLFRLFYAAGPGSMLEFNLRFGIQF